MFLGEKVGNVEKIVRVVMNRERLSSGYQVSMVSE